MNNRLINTKVAGGGGGCTDIVDNYDPFGGNGVALYQLNGNADDVSGNYNGTASNVTYGVGVFGQAGVFNGSSSKISVTSTSTTPVNFSNENFSISTWVKVDSFATSPCIFSKWPASTSTNRVVLAYFNTSGSLSVLEGVGPNNNSSGPIPTTPNLSTGVWYNIVYVRTNTTGALYVNGALSDSVSLSNTINAGSTDPFLIGMQDPTNKPFDGSIDQVRIFNTALTPLEVEALYTEELCICDGTVDTLDILGDGSCVATYQLDGNANDLSGNYSGTPTDVSYGVGEFDLAGVFSSGSFIDLGSNFSLFNSTQNLSMSLWFNTNSSGRIFGSEYNLSYFPIEINSNTDGTVYLAIRNSGGTPKITSSTTFNNGSWHHLVGIVNVSSNLLSLYINNTLIGTTSVGGSGSSNQKRFIGGEGGSFNGSIDQVRIFNKALNSTEVTTLYNETACTKAACTGTTNTLDILSDGSCIAAYPLDGSPADLSGNHHGTIVGQLSFPPNGKFNQCITPTETSYITVPPSIYNGNSGTSISLWFKSNGVNYTTPFYDLTNTGSGFLGGGWKIRTGLNGTGLAWAFARPSDGANLFLSGEVSTLNLNDGQWHHLVACWNGTTNTNGATLYLDNILINSLTSNSSYPTSFVNNNYIGIDNQSSGRACTGGVDQVRFFNKALSAGEVTTLYNETPCN